MKVEETVLAERIAKGFMKALEDEIVFICLSDYKDKILIVDMAREIVIRKIKEQEEGQPE